MAISPLRIEGSALVIGDIHGCRRELEELIDLAGIDKDCWIIATGDIVDRGPDCLGVVEFFRNHPRALTVMGNHERKHRRSYQGEIKPATSQELARAQIGEDRYPDVIAYFASLPLVIELPEAIIIHGFLDPEVPLLDQDERTVAGTLSAQRNIFKRFGVRWFESYKGEKPLIVGHRDYLNNGEPLVHEDRVFGLDTSCVLGGRLTGLLLPSFRLISVPSHHCYWTKPCRYWLTHRDSDRQSKNTPHTVE
jgi:serine/threonine protein phosphatase 1